MGLKVLRPRIATLDTRTVKPRPKTADPYYLTAEHRAWRNLVISRAGGQCEDIDKSTGQRCDKAEPAHRMFADHIKERRDGGDPLDPANGKCLCAHHHGLKTASHRRARLSLTWPAKG